MTISTVRTLAAAIVLAFSAGASAQAMTKADYKMAKDGIAATYKADRSACVPLSVDDRAACRSAARNKRNAATAELQARKPVAAGPVASTAKKETAQAYVDDSVITARVKTAVFEEPTLKSAEINVETSKGRVQLSGFVRSAADIQRAVEVTRKVRGVASVQNAMIVKGRP